MELPAYGKHISQQLRTLWTNINYLAEQGMVAPNNLTNELTMYPDIEKTNTKPRTQKRNVEDSIQLQLQKLLKTPLVELSFYQYLKP